MGTPQLCFPFPQIMPRSLMDELWVPGHALLHVNWGGSANEHA